MSVLKKVAMHWKPVFTHSRWLHSCMLIMVSSGMFLSTSSALSCEQSSSAKSSSVKSSMASSSVRSSLQNSSLRSSLQSSSVSSSLRSSSLPSSSLNSSSQQSVSNNIALLEDFTSLRLNGEGKPLFHAYTGEDPGQTSTLEGGSLKLTVPAGYGVYKLFQPYFSGFPYPRGFARSHIKSGTWDADNNRLVFLVKPNITVLRNPSGGDNLQIGTYVKAHNDPDTRRQGDHYYHLIGTNFYANRWTKVIVNRTPQHQVGHSSNINWGDDPEFASQGNHYFDALTLFYFDTQGSAFGNSTWLFDDFLFKKVTGEPDAEISSITAQYTGSRYEVSWAGLKNTSRRYEIRYKTSSMKTSGFLSGIDGGTTTNPGSAYTGTFWASPAMHEQTPGMYVAIRVQGQSPFTEVYIPNGMAPGNHGE